MLTPFRNFSLSRKLLSIIMVTCSGALILACAVLMVYDLLLYREDMSQQLSVQADIIGANSTIALAQQDRKVANQTLQALRFQPGITQAIIYAKDGTPFATFYRLSDAAPVFSHIEDFGFDFMTLSLVREIMDNGNRIGTIVIQARLDEVQERWMAFATIVGGVIFAASLFAFLLSNRLQTLISDPILRLTLLAQRVSSEKNYSLRETKNSQDEIGTLIDGVNDMLEQIQHRDRQLQKHQEELEELVNHRTAELAGLHRQVALILDTAGEGIIGLDQQGRTKFVNAAASRMLGWTGKELQSQSLHNFIHQNNSEGSPYHPATEFAHHETAENGAASSEIHDVFWRKDGTSFPVEYMSAPIRDETGLVTGFVMTFRDVTVQKQFEGALYDAVQTAEDSNHAKSRFLANMSHEIRTPMNGLLGMSELLLKTPQTSKQRQFTESLDRSGQHLLRILNDILDFSKIEAKKLELEIIEFPLHQTIEDTVQLFTEPAQKKGLELICHIESTVPNCIHGDPGRFRQILTNLIGNAIKFTTQGEVYVHAVLIQEANNCLELQVEVMDTGIGIPPEAQSKIFEAFSQADGSTTRKYGGTGLGLTITKELVELMAGKLSMESKEGIGSKFMFTVSLEKGTQSLSSVQETGLLQGLRILLVEDNHRNQVALKEMADLWGVDIQLANDGTEALRILNQQMTSPQQFDAVFIDQTLPDMEGIELAERIRVNLTLASLPLALLTPWHLTEEQEQRASLAGLQQHILKPVRQADLYDQLRALRGNQESILDSSSLKPSSVQHNLGSASILLAEDHQVNQEIVKAMAEHLGLHLEVVNNGLEAIQALARQSYDLVLMDWQMPEMDGLEATKEIRKREAFSVKGEEENREDREASSQRRDTLHEIRDTKYERRLPIIAITAHTSAEDRQTCLNAGTDDVLAKPFSLEQLQTTLRQWLPSSAHTESCGPQAQEAPPVPATSLQGSDTTNDILNTSALDQIKSLQRPNAPSIVAKVLNHYFSNTPKLLADLQEGLRQADRALLGRAAHTLKSSSANVGAIRVSEKCKTLEHLARSSKGTDGLESLVKEIVAEYEIVSPLLTTHCNEETL